MLSQNWKNTHPIDRFLKTTCKDYINQVFKYWTALLYTDTRPFDYSRNIFIKGKEYMNDDFKENVCLKISEKLQIKPEISCAISVHICMCSTLGVADTHIWSLEQD